MRPRLKRCGFPASHEDNLGCSSFPISYLTGFPCVSSWTPFKIFSFLSFRKGKAVPAPLRNCIKGNKCLKTSYINSKCKFSITCLGRTFGIQFSCDNPVSFNNTFTVNTALFNISIIASCKYSLYKN